MITVFDISLPWWAILGGAAILILVGYGFIRDQRPTNYKSDFGKVDLSVFNRGLSPNGGTQTMTVEASSRHVLIFGSSGSGKSSCFYSNNLLGAPGRFGSTITADFSQSLREICSGYQASFPDTEIYQLHPERPDVSIGINPLDNLDENGARQIAHVIIGQHTGGDAYWHTMSGHLCAILIELLQYVPVDLCHLGSLYSLTEQMMANPESVEKWFLRYAPDPTWQSFLALKAIPDRTFNGIISTLLSKLSPLRSPATQRIFAKTTIDFNEFRTKPRHLFVHGSELNSEVNSLTISLVSSVAMRHFMSHRPKPGNRNIYCMFDEASLMSVPLDVWLSQSRKHNISISASFQSVGQLESKGHGYAKTVQESVGTTIHFPGQSIETANRLSALLGKYEFDQDGQRRVRELMTPSEVRSCGKIIMLHGHTPPMVLPPKPYYNQLGYHLFKKLPPAKTIGSAVKTVSLPTPRTFERYERERLTTA